MTSSPHHGATAPAQLDWHDGQPFSIAFGDVYFSRDSGLEETRHVFLKHNQLEERFAALPPHGRFVIAETGFGTGLNFLCAWQQFEALAPADARLHFVSAEKYPLTPRDLSQALALWPELAPWSAQLLAQYDTLAPGWHRFLLAGGRVTLTLMVGDVLDALPRLDARIDAWFLDGFAPAKNPDMWQPELFRQMARLSAPGASFATFTSAGVVRRGLAEAGFEVKKAPGHGRKRHISHGWIAQPPTAGWQPPWYARPPQRRRERSAIVIGGGIAGAATAHSLAVRGWQVTVIERLPRLAGAASGNPQGVLYTKLSPHMTPLTQLVLSGYAYSLRTLATQLPKDGKDWAACGVLQLAYDAKESEKQQALTALGLPLEIMRKLDQAEAGELAGMPLPSGGLFFPQGGWVHPPALVRQLATHPNITHRIGRSALELSHNPAEGCWTVSDAEGPLAAASVVVLAASAETAQFDPTSHLPLKKIRGQVSEVAATEDSAALRTVLCGEGYISPARQGRHCLGATFKFDTDNLTVREEEHAENLAMLAELAPALHAALGQSPQAIAGRAAFRCTSPDYLPLIGPVVTRRDFVRAYRELAHDATLQPETDCPWTAGLYVNAAHGSRGMITAPLSGEILAALLEDEPAPLPADLMQAVHPSRFLLRDLIRRKLALDES
ncbi:bifunctional tRNA (5-methylaminomethyl-2-thiouridine)(34)-methyltransferase MnmD/FAD-dependent 5-carboxymethylaminomethyl-2-thiouridine(34) oxidoreductase MnmC [Chromobacterium sinusclupearum]|uniref:tRNA 5-methylaminomethyl-2-thiouridine biosynthesis bifunctional protein MnmC n=1 Tax=Chromobacterium sinusclupearum TaxID=2077146 RepID=A0A2K4MLZ6_9NEIS|nr:bifunctional tRNA (5-methylaminomethyl-2-thiouridine)(34)-methyltransferase MnmD/FAD-dependent 5-carboxymethylaminomethyl-2-thiouridine(34) oxidoreductase MnmC [Chromobacterium sinusclupearum]POA98103.1 bifunctional tRNA (5-methylaminomethyl-2-thiouridine)(34)-methyltransferase MnmD/FAD-dependent 5-carboxymethylaminomethyl-2-thiouridine(34) oxidoreductase MnmC [Chromobacterium sinusclupearum]